MKISEYSVKNYQFTLVMFLGVLSLGVYTLFNMPRGEDPETHSPQFPVVVVYPGTSPGDMEELVLDPLEARISELEDLKRIQSTVYDGVAVLQVEFEYTVDVENKYQEMVREVNAVRQELPADIYSLEVRKVTPSDVNIYQYALVSENAPYHALKAQAERFEEQLEKVKALKKVQTWGFPNGEVEIVLDIDKMAQQKIAVGRVIGALQSSNTTIPGGSVNVNTRKFNVKTSGGYQNLDEIRNTIVASNGNKIVYLKDVAQVRQAYEDEKYLARYNGHRAVFVTAAQKDGQNIFKVRDQVEPIVAQFAESLPKNIDFVKVFDQTASVDKRLTRFGIDFGIAILLVLVTLLPLGYRASVVVMISIPLSLAIGLILLSIFGFTINQLSVVGMIIALGILVDDSIVVVENIERYLREGHTRVQAAILASRQIGLAVLGCTATLCFAFMPLMFLPEAAGDFIRSMPAAVIFTVVASLIVSLTIVPFLSSRLLSESHSQEGNVFMRGLQWIISGSFSKALHYALAHPIITLLVAAAIFGGSLTLIPSVGFSLFPKSEKPMFLVNIETPVGTNLYATNRVARYVDSVLRARPQVRHIATNVGQGNPRIYYNVIPRDAAENFAQIFVQTNTERAKEKVALIDELRTTFAHYPNAKIEVKDFEQGPPLEAPLAYRILGDNLDTLRSLAGRVEAMLQATPGTIYINNPLKTQPTDFKVRINKDKAGLLGVPVAEIDRTVRLGIAGLNVGKYRDEAGEEYNLNLSLPRQGPAQGYEVFDQLFVNSVQGTAIPLRQLADIRMESSPNQIRHFDKTRFVTISSFLQTGYLTDNVNREFIEKLAAFPWPKGYTYSVAGEQENRERSFGGLGTIILITAFGFFGILVLEFRTFKSTFIVLSVIPLGIIGAILILLATGNTFSFTAVIGLIALVGIEVKNSILLVDFTNQLREEGMPLDQAIQKAGEVRFVPIVLTSLTAIGGLIPLVLEYSPLYSPLALVLIGGLISSTLLSRLVTPVMYKLLPPRIKARPAAQPPVATPHDEGVLV
ncbi:MAG: efflux RND transporter permease subunit [Bernardetiaceae bacterium]|jgi:multidrug efflux pump subunit AcrB|nr:efflux RND transporter permease subunit [Bernardetiaceae bacterium]